MIKTSLSGLIRFLVEILSADQEVEGVCRSSEIDSILQRHEEYLFLNQNDYWIIRYHGHTVCLKSTRGLCCLAVLLGNSRREFHVSQLLACSPDVPTPSAVVAAQERIVGGLYGGVPVLDAKAKSECRCRLYDLRRELAEAERFNDQQRKAAAQNEIQAIADYLASAVGLGSRERKASSDAERARSAVTKCIKKAIQKIGEANPSLGYYLASTIKTGYFCSYNPYPDRLVAWKF